MRDLRTVNCVAGQKIESDEVVKRVGDISYRDMGVMSRMSLIDEGSALIVGTGLRVEASSGMTVNIPSGVVFQRSINIVNPCIQLTDQTVTLDAATGIAHTDIIEAQIKKISDKTDYAQIATLASGSSISISNEEIKRDIKYYLSARKKTDDTDVTEATAGTLTGTVAITGTLDLSENYLLNVKDGEDGDYIEVDCRGADPTATSKTEIIDAINAAMGRTMASAGAGDVIVWTGEGTGESSTFTIKPPFTDPDKDCFDLISGVSIGGVYKYTYTGENEWFKLAEIDIDVATTTITTGLIRNIDEQSTWASGDDVYLMAGPIGPILINLDDNTILSSSLTAVGVSALAANTTGINNVAVGSYALAANTTGTNNTAVGYQALIANNTGVNNTAVGHQALTANTVSNNTAVGYHSLVSNTTGGNNTAVGINSLKFNTTGTNNTAVGYQALIANNTGVNNTAVGVIALTANTTGVNNTAVGLGALAANTTASYNTAIGSTSLNLNTTGEKNTALGYSSLALNTIGGSNTAVGVSALAANTTGSNNTALGYGALVANTIAGANTAVGASALATNITGLANTAVGRSALSTNTVSNNTAVGYFSLASNTTGASNVAVGYQSLTANTTGGNNTAIGHQALLANTTGINNTALGYGSLFNNSAGMNNVAVGVSALYSTTTAGSDCTAVGMSALTSNLGSQNTSLGSSAASTLATGANCTTIGYNAQPTTSSTNNQVILGNSSVTQIRAAVTTITAISDMRDKDNIKDLNDYTDFIKELRPVSFQWDKREWYVDKYESDKDGFPILPKTKDGSKKTDAINLGFIAQEIVELEDKYNLPFKIVDRTNPNKLEMTTGELLVPLIKTVQALIDRIETLEKK